MRISIKREPEQTALQFVWKMTAPSIGLFLVWLVTFYVGCKWLGRDYGSQASFFAVIVTMMFYFLFYYSKWGCIDDRLKEVKKITRTALYIMIALYTVYSCLCDMNIIDGWSAVPPITESIAGLFVICDFAIENFLNTVCKTKIVIGDMNYETFDSVHCVHRTSVQPQHLSCRRRHKGHGDICRH